MAPPQSGLEKRAASAVGAARQSKPRRDELRRGEFSFLVTCYLMAIRPVNCPMVTNKSSDVDCSGCSHVGADRSLRKGVLAHYMV